MSRASIFLIFVDDEIRFRIVATNILQALKIADRLGVYNDFEIKTATLP